MIASVERIAITFDADDHLGMAPEPGCLQAKHCLARGAQNGAPAAKIDRGAARLGREVGAERVDALKHRLLRLRVALPQEGQLSLGRARSEEQGQSEESFAHQSITPDQSGSEPSCGVVSCRASLPSSATR